MPATKKDIGWSLTKARMFNECPHRYYYQYYYCKYGYQPDAPEDMKLAYEMSTIQSMDMWIGDAVHKTIEMILDNIKSNNSLSVADAKKYLLTKLSNDWKGSTKQLWRGERKGIYPNIFEHYYKMPVGQASIDRIKEKGLLSITNIMKSEVLNQITLTPAQNWLPIEKYASFYINGILLYVKFDFALKLPNELIIYDWKTGKPDNNSEIRQLTCYGLYTSDKWNIPIENVRTVSVHLQPEIFINEHIVNADSIEDAENYIEQTYKSMKKCIPNGDKSVSGDNFPMTGNILRCSRCNFKGICPQGKSLSLESDLDEQDDY